MSHRFWHVLAKVWSLDIVFFLFCLSLSTTPVCFCLSCSRKTGHYTVQQNQNAHGDRYGTSTTTNSTKTTGTDPLSLPNTSISSCHRSQPSCSPKPGSSPRHSPNSRSRPRPTCQRCNSQVGCEWCNASVVVPYLKQDSACSNCGITITYWKAK